ncbi:hypothetical protein PBAL39_13587 [Pedobacter sp. BAL39]|uniref:hypothetical protein n=1 Tax=Pedobacter sp. BAL39 TaxID=391596 RepID=UPI0001559C3E|nr:hypothetical protein [Pedobacter sp. BAL39]EDM35268.1 hypothetical protein PBAL39_13587 [Pedobacter sp. BAL39]
MSLYNKNKKLIISIITSSALSLISHHAAAQIFNAEQNPLSVKWRQINASGFQIIYPQEMEKEAQRMTNTIRHIYPYVGASIGRGETTIPILLQNRGVVANGFVQLGPKKSEFYTTPPQQFDSQDWLNNLAVHELRHVAQFDKLTSGRPKPFPEEVYLAWFGASIPIWFFEGDAVSTETALTHAGRGRQPSWIMPYRTQLLEGKSYSYSKQNFGSQKDLTPGYYQFGYLMSANIRAQQGRSVFDSVLTDIQRRPFRPYPFSGSLKKFSGKGSQEWFRNTTEVLKKEWARQASEMNTTDYPALNGKSTVATSYFLPVRLEDGALLSLKQSKDAAPHFVRIDADQKESNIIGIGPQEQPWFSYANGIIVWDEIRYDPRYRQRSYSIICSYDMKYKKMKKLSSKSRLFSPSLSADGKTIVAVQIGLDNQSNLVELDAASGTITHTYPNPYNLILQTPAFRTDKNQVVFVAVSEAGKSLMTVERSGKMTQIIAASNQQLSRPIYVSQGIAFNAHYNGIDNIYYIVPGEQKISALSASKYGAFNATPTADQQHIVFNNYSLGGYEIAQSQIVPGPIGKAGFVYFGEETEKQENTGNVFDHIPDSTFTSKPYHDLQHLFRVHSIVPVFEDEYRGGLQLNSDNLLNTMSTFAGVNYYRDLGRFEYEGGFIFKKLYPIISTTYRNRPRQTYYAADDGRIVNGEWREHNVELEASVPLNFNAGDHNYGFSFRTSTSYTRRYLAEQMPENYITSLKFPLEYQLTMSHTKRVSERDIAPKWGQILRLSYLHQPFDPQLPGNLFSAEAFAYFPGVARNHSLLVNFNYQESSGIRAYDRQINAVYGYSNIPAYSLLKNTLLLNYRFPIAFPDLEVGPLGYLRNVRGTLFSHYENIGKDTNIGEPKTFGFELRSDINPLRYDALMEFGARVVFVNRIYHQNPILELILNFSL